MLCDLIFFNIKKRILISLINLNNMNKNTITINKLIQIYDLVMIIR